MSNTNHTPGPWIAEGGDGNGMLYVGNDDLGVHVASVNVPIHGTSLLSKEQANANAQLISSAPELLEALKEIAKGQNGELKGEFIIRARKIAQAAIAKAEGK